MASDSSLPLTPWGERIVERKTYMFDVRDGKRRSGFAPEYPTLPDPKTWLQLPPPASPPPPSPLLTTEERLLRQIQELNVSEARRQQQRHQSSLRRFTPRTYEDLDRVLYDEVVQRQTNYGPRTWECAALSSEVYYEGGTQVPGDQLVDSETGRHVEAKARIKVDESKWFPFLKKDRWYDWIQTSPPGPPDEQGKVWSIDDPDIWAAIRTPLDEFGVPIIILTFPIETMLWGRMAYWVKAIPAKFKAPEPFPNCRVLLGRNLDIHLTASGGDPTPVDWAAISRRDERHWRDRLAYLLHKHLMSFAILDCIEAHACDIDQDVPEYTSICHINCDKVTLLMRDDLTLSERALLEIQLAVTIVHEFMHAIYSARKALDRKKDGNCIDPKDPFRRGDPLYNCEGVTELGVTMEQHVFDGLMDGRPSSSGIPIVMMCVRAPNRTMPNTSYRGSVPGSWQADPLHVHFPTTLWASKLLSEEFWADPRLPRKSDNFFHKTPVFQCDEKPGGGFGFVYAKNFNSFPIVYPEDDRAADTWSDRQQLWAIYRMNWYEREFPVFDISPWSDMFARHRLSEFSRAFAKRDEFACGQIAQWFLKGMPWEQSLKEYTDKGATNNWIFHVIGLLMSASIPTREREYTVSGMNALPFSYVGFPSRSADAAGQKTRVYIPSEIYTRKDIKTVPASQFYNPFAGDSLPADRIAQDDYLALADAVVAHVSGRFPIYPAWVAELVKRRAEIKDARDKIRRDYPSSHRQRWSSAWDFVVPAYSVDAVVWDVRLNRFVDLWYNVTMKRWEYRDAITPKGFI
ncbi:hypothetical protein F5Y17DRAFT_460732 [Xylariaceae sp. FL0594]|nr:hypothetical protein F5Y17DRAFT_460732 [Xylariaceae sp. FL0594]